MSPTKQPKIEASAFPEEREAKKTALVSEQEILLQRLAEAGGKLTAEEDVLFEGTKLIIPAKMDIGDAIHFLAEKQSEDERTVQFSRTFDFRPWDGARATMRALKATFGMVSQRATMGMFGPNPPEMRTINVGVGETEQVPWGRLAIPLLPGVDFYLGGILNSEKGNLFAVSAEGPRKYRHHIEGVFNLIASELQKDSLYRGKAFDGQANPEFLDLSTVSPDKVIYSEEVMTQLEANVWSLIRYSDKMAAHGVPLKRAVLFEGPYGTGKTLGAYLTAQIAVQNGWSFIYCRPGRDSLSEVLATARLYQPACVFFEDIDTVAAASSGRADHVTELLDLFDGIQAKGTRIMCVLTTNNVQSIHKGMVRPGRLDSVITIGALDTRGIERMAKAVITADCLDSDIDWAKVGEAMDGFLPAFVRESLDRAVRYNMSRNQGDLTSLGTSDFVDAANGLRPQLDLMNGAGDTPVIDTVEVALARTVRGAIKGSRVLDDDGDDVGEIVPPSGNLLRNN